MPLGEIKQLRRLIALVTLGKKITSQSMYFARSPLRLCRKWAKDSRRLVKSLREEWDQNSFRKKGVQLHTANALLEVEPMHVARLAPKDMLM